MTTSNSVETTNTQHKLDKKDLRGIFLRGCSMDFSWNFERQCSMGFAFGMGGVIKKLYPNKADRAEALKRHLEFYNVTSQMAGFPLAIAAAMEEESISNPNFDKSSINSVKTALMGPLSAIGDSVFQGTLRIIATSIGATLAMQGNILGAILFLLIFNIPCFLARWYLTKIGYTTGTTFIKNLEKSGALQLLTYGAGIVGLMVIGAMVATTISLHTPITIGSGESPYALQSLFDDIMPCLIPLGVFGITYKAIGKTKNSLVIIIAMFVISILGALLGIFG